MTPTDKPMTVDALMKLATDYAHCYAFVGDDTMPRRQAELRAAIEQYGREQYARGVNDAWPAGRGPNVF